MFKLDPEIGAAFAVLAQAGAGQEQPALDKRRMGYSATLTPEPPISFGTSFIFGRPSRIRSFVS